MTRAKDRNEAEAADFNPDEIKGPIFVEVTNDTTPEELGEFVKLELIGDCIEGTYAKPREVESLYGKQTVYDIANADGLWSLAGNWDLDQKMSKLSPGVFVRITYDTDAERTARQVRLNHNPMKVYKVEATRLTNAQVPDGTPKRGVKRNPKYA